MTGRTTWLDATIVWSRVSDALRWIPGYKPPSLPLTLSSAKPPDCINHISIIEAATPTQWVLTTHDYSLWWPNMFSCHNRPKTRLKTRNHIRRSSCTTTTTHNKTSHVRSCCAGAALPFKSHMYSAWWGHSRQVHVVKLVVPWSLNRERSAHHNLSLVSFLSDTIMKDNRPY